MPNQISLSKKGGFQITSAADGQIYPLFLFPLNKKTNAFVASAVQSEVFLEKSIILLDENIRFLNYLSGESQLIGGEYEN